MSIRKILSPLLIISYVCGLRVIEFPADISRQWFSLLYMLLVWSLYYFVYIYKVIPYTSNYHTLYHIWFDVNIFIAVSSIIIGVYYDKAFRNCIKNLTAVNNTLEKLGTITDYKFYMRTIWLILGWFMIAILIICIEIRSLTNDKKDIEEAIYVSLIGIYCIHVNIISDLIITSILRYIGLKFDQINENLEKLSKSNKCRIKRAWEHSMLLFHPSGYARASRSAYMIWIVIHLHLELRKISRKIDIIFGTQMTIEMGCYFAFIATGLQEIFNMTFITNYNIFHVMLILIGFFQHVFRLFLINYECEKVSIKANATGNFINKISYSNCDMEIRENILQFLLTTQSPFKLCGLGLFQFGFQFLQKFTTSVATVSVILLQAYTNK